MEARAILRYARISPRKVSIVMDLIRNKPLDEALAILQYTPKAACEPLLKLVKSAAANAENNFNMDKNNLYATTMVLSILSDTTTPTRVFLRLRSSIV